MIEIQLSTALALYSTILGLLLGGIWLYTVLVVPRTHAVMEKQHLWRCVFCGYTYLDEGAQALSQCPQCESLNSADDKHARFVRARTSKDDSGRLPEDALPSKNTSKRKRPHQRRRGPRRR